MSFKVGDKVRYVGNFIPQGEYTVVELPLHAKSVRLSHYDTNPEGWLAPGCYIQPVTELRDGMRVRYDDPVASSPSPGAWLASLSSEERKEVAVARGLFAYFPDALALVARHSVRSNEKHNPGEPVHWSREKSSDHEDCIGRHSIAVAVDPNSLDGDVPHIVCRAWRALAALQLWAEAQKEKT